MAGDVADGLIGHPMCPLRWLDEVMIPSFEKGLARSGRQRSDLDFLPTVCCAIDDDEARAHRRRPPHDRLLRDRAHLQAALGAARVRRRRRPRPGTPSARATWPPCRTRSRTRWSRPTRPRGHSTRSAPGSRRCAERGDGVWLTPPTYFIPPEQLVEYQQQDRRGLRPGGLVKAFPRTRGLRSQPAALHRKPHSRRARVRSCCAKVMASRWFCCTAYSKPIGCGATSSRLWPHTLT